ncbi:hypothetical protein M3Y97_01003100 [Aphelenchoides bicaudatus]|nr:hypothetical protein M3Y97_01003100 [Aphelenchoides bicaudatus]
MDNSTLLYSDLDVYKIGFVYMCFAFVAWIGITVMLCMCMLNQITLSPFSEVDHPPVARLVVTSTRTKNFANHVKPERRPVPASQLASPSQPVPAGSKVTSPSQPVSPA